jgi:multiple sugar transport system substrate-binding protein
MQYVDAETHTWTTENFIKAVEAVYAHTGKTVGAVFCAGQGGDQGTRALVNNLYGGTYTNADYTAYTWSSEENLKALNLLNDLEGIKFDASLAGGDEAGEFAKGNLAMAFCWNGATHTNNLEVIGDSFEVLPMAFPSQNGTDVQLCGGIWGFGIFDNGDAAKTEAAKNFVKFMADENTKASVEASGFWSTRKSVTGLYAGDALKDVYGSFMQYMGNYYNVVPGWAAQRTEWWNMLQDIGEGADIATTVAAFEANANAHAAG